MLVTITVVLRSRASAGEGCDFCSEGPHPVRARECLLPGQSGRPAAARSWLFLQGVSPASCSGAAAGSTWGPGVYWHLCPCSHAAASRLSHGGCPGSSARRGVAWVGRVSPAGSRRLWVHWPLCCQRVGCLCSAGSGQQRPPPICPSCQAPGPPVSSDRAFPGTWLPSRGVECGAGVLLSSGWGAWQGGHRVSCLSTFVQWSQHLCAPCGSS